MKKSCLDVVIGHNYFFPLFIYLFSPEQNCLEYPIGFGGNFRNTVNISISTHMYVAFLHKAKAEYAITCFFFFDSRFSVTLQAKYPMQHLPTGGLETGRLW